MNQKFKNFLICLCHKHFFIFFLHSSNKSNHSSTLQVMIVMKFNFIDETSFHTLNLSILFEMILSSSLFIHFLNTIIKIDKYYPTYFYYNNFDRHLRNNCHLVESFRSFLVTSLS